MNRDKKWGIIKLISLNIFDKYKVKHTNGLLHPFSSLAAFCRSVTASRHYLAGMIHFAPFFTLFAGRCGNNVHVSLLEVL